MGALPAAWGLCTELGFRTAPAQGARLCHTNGNTHTQTRPGRCGSSALHTGSRASSVFPAGAQQVLSSGQASSIPSRKACEEPQGRVIASLTLKEGFMTYILLGSETFPDEEMRGESGSPQQMRGLFPCKFLHLHPHCLSGEFLQQHPLRQPLLTSSTWTVLFPL